MVRITVVGLRELLRKLSPRVLDVPMRRFMEKSSKFEENKQREASPVNTGRTRRSHTSRVSASGREAEAGVVGVDYARFPHYGTIFMSGQPWITDTAEESDSAVRAFTRQLGEDVEGEFRRL